MRGRYEGRERPRVDAAGEDLAGSGLLRFPTAPVFRHTGSPEPALGDERVDLAATLPALLVRFGPVAGPADLARFWATVIFGRGFGSAMLTTLGAAGAGLREGRDELDVVAAGKADARPVGFLNIWKAPILGVAMVCEAGAASPSPCSHVVSSASGSGSVAERACDGWTCRRVARLPVVFLDLPSFLIARWDFHKSSRAVSPALDVILLSGTTVVPSAIPAAFWGLMDPQVGDIVIAWTLPRLVGVGGAPDVSAAEPRAGRDG